MANLPTLAQRCAELYPLAAPGIAYMTGFIWASVSFLLGTLTGWYVKGRGMSGVKIDLDNVKLELAHIKGTLDGNRTSIVTPPQTA